MPPNSVYAAARLRQRLMLFVGQHLLTLPSLKKLYLDSGLLVGYTVHG